MNKIKLTNPKEIRNIIEEKQLTNIIIETGDENVYLTNEHKFIVTKEFFCDENRAFENCKTLKKIDMLNFNIVSKQGVTTMSLSFKGCDNLKEINIIKKGVYSNAYFLTQQFKL